MTIRRGFGARVPLAGLFGLQNAPRPLRHGALLVGGLLLAPPSLVAAMHPTHSRAHAGSESAGKVSAHAVHEVSTREDMGKHAHGSHDTDRASAHTKLHGRKPANAEGSSRTHHTGDAGETAPASTRAHKGKRHHEQQIDDPAPSYRAQAESKHHELSFARHLRDRSGPAIERTSVARGPKSRWASHHEQPSVVSGGERANADVAHLDSGLTVDDFVRGSRQAPAYKLDKTTDTAAVRGHADFLTTGISHPDDDERLLTHSTAPASLPSARAQHATSMAHAPAPASSAPADAASSPATAPQVTAIATALTEPAPTKQPASEVVQGFGAEVDLRAPAAKPSALNGTALRETSAQQERDLREAAEVASAPMFIPLYARDGSLLVPPPLKGSHNILVHQNQMADDAGLTRIQDDADLARLRRAHLLVDFPESASLRMNESLPENRRNARPWTVKFAVDIAHAFYLRFGEPLQVNSAVRTVAYQLRLQRVNGNAAAVEGEGASPHLTGQALDFGKRGMSMAEIAWMRSYLTPLIEAGKIDVEEEFQQACFHISVYASYVPVPAPRSPVKTFVAQANKPTHVHTSALATAVGADDNLR